MSKLVASLPLHRILLAILASNPLPQTVSVSFSIITAAIQNTGPDVFEKSFTAEVSADRNTLPCTVLILARQGGYDVLARLLPFAWSPQVQDKGRS